MHSFCRLKRSIDGLSFSLEVWHDALCLLSSSIMRFLLFCVGLSLAIDYSQSRSNELRPEAIIDGKPVELKNPSKASN